MFKGAKHRFRGEGQTTPADDETRRVLCSPVIVTEEQKFRLSCRVGRQPSSRRYRPLQSQRPSSCLLSPSPSAGVGLMWWRKDSPRKLCLWTHHYRTREAGPIIKKPDLWLVAPRQALKVRRPVIKSPQYLNLPLHPGNNNNHQLFQFQ